jgi:hypothetical protein
VPRRRQLNGALYRIGDRRVVDLRANRTNEVEDLLHDRVRHLDFVDDLGEHCLRIGGVRDLPAKQSGHHLGPGERVLDLVGGVRSTNRRF